MNNTGVYGIIDIFDLNVVNPNFEISTPSILIKDLSFYYYYLVIPFQSSQFLKIA